MLIGGQDFRLYRIERDDDKIADLIAREAAFWQAVTRITSYNVCYTKLLRGFQLDAPQHGGLVGQIFRGLAPGFLQP